MSLPVQPARCPRESLGHEPSPLASPAAPRLVPWRPLRSSVIGSLQLSIVDHVNRGSGAAHRAMCQQDPSVDRAAGLGDVGVTNHYRFRALTALFSGWSVMACPLTRAHAQLGCSEAVITHPASGAWSFEPLVELRWQALAGPERYRVELESRLPEGRVLASIDTHVGGTSFRPPRPLADSRAVIRVRVTAGCPADDGNRLRTQPATFFIDTSPLCPGPSLIDVGERHRSIAWTPTPKATRYDVTLLRPDGIQIVKGQTQRPEFAVPASEDPLIAVVRPYCATGFGPYTRRH